ncbi:MAG: hypothetical protein Q7J44_20120 [Pseudotabrizicola sp.]|uniref:hypothetical protein n=1 Tax=Pseudotabrizicola sp. TaxID=2939647 RepID=UPI0027176718|nr:hypothetical protein [Pseudotabrizicola sp.]MDO9640844.1 hypothetical protein [Pseudotabrizicola sp.]
MKKFLLSCVAAASISGAAHAATYSVDVTATPFRVPGMDGLQTRAVVLSPSGPQTFNGATYSFDLTNAGDSVSMNVYGLVHYDGPLDPDDLIPRPSTATFDFGGAIGSLTILGTSFGVAGAPASALATFISGIISIAPGLGIKITLADTVFGTDGTSFVQGRAGIGFVNATFELVAVPVPGALPLSLTALGLMGFVAQRRKSRKTAA